MKIKRISTTQAIVTRIKERIQLGEFSPGDMLPSERVLQEELGVSRLALREGLARLSALGIIRVDHGKGAFITSETDTSALFDTLRPLLPRNDVQRANDLFRTRAVIESELAAEAALHRTEEDLEQLRDILNCGREELDDEKAFADLDFSFHREIARIADNVFLTVMWEALARHIFKLLTEFDRDRANRAAAHKRHKLQLEAIAQGDVETVRRLVREHIRPCLKHYVEHLKSCCQSEKEENAT